MARPKDVARDEAALRRLAKAVAGHRRATGKTQEDLAYEAGMSVRHLQNLEAAAINPGYLTLVAIAATLGMSISELLDGVDVHRKTKS
jgi:transcriptional regulator with XRE-family HTH domain